MKRSRSAFVLGLAMLVLSACSQDPVPKVAPRESPAPSVSESADASDPSPVDTVRAWVDAQNAAMRTGDSDPVRALSTDDCNTCDGLIDPIDKVHASGGYFHTKGWVVDAAKLAHGDGIHAKVNAGITIRGGETLNAKGEEPVSYGVDRSIMVFKLTREDSSWRVSFIGFLS